jgi:PAS domain S-box-containing protein
MKKMESYSTIGEQLKKELERLRVLTDGIDEIIYVIDPDTYEILFANKKTKELFGKKIIDKKCYEVFQNLNRPCPFCTKNHLFGENLEKTHIRGLQNKRNKRWYKCVNKAIKQSGGKYVQFGIAIDVTEQKEMEEALRESEQLFRSVVENSHDCILIIHDNFRIIYANDEAVRLSGYPKEEIIGQDFREFLDENSKSLVKDRYLRRQKGENVPLQYKFKIVRKNGEKRDVEIKSTVMQDSQGRVRTVAQLLDITEHERMEEDRKRFEERLSALNTYGQSLNRAKNMEEVYKLTLDAMDKTLGFEFADIFMIDGKMLCLVVHRGYSKNLSVKLPLDGEKGITVRAARAGKPIYVPDARKEKAYVKGGEGILSELAVPIKIGNRVLGALNVESKRLSAFDKEDEKLLEILASHAATAIGDLKRQEKLKIISKKLTNLMKSSTEIMNAKDMRKRLKVIAKAILKFGWRRVVISLRDENLEGIELVTAGLTKEETRLLLERKASGHVWRERLGPKFERFKIGEFYCLPWSDPWIREKVHGVPPGTAPNAATTYTGVPSKLSPEEMVDWHPQDMLYAPLRTPEGRIVGILSMDDPVDGRKPTRESLTPLELFLHQAAITIENAQLIDSLRKARKQLEEYAGQLEQKVEERTRELKKSQEQLLKAQRLAVIGELAGMVGHDLRNPLTSISGAEYYLKKRLSPEVDSKIKEMLALIEKNIAYSNKIINDLLDYSKEIELELTESNSKLIVKEALSLVKIPKNVRIVDLTENKPKIMVDVGKIKRAFVNIIKNAVEAMTKGGTLTIKSRKLEGNLEIAFSDTGAGMSKETLEKLWAPLFTTKAKGMGFGLPICKRFIEAHGGSISAKSTPRKGTTFTVTLPIEPKIEKGGEKVWVKSLESSLLTMMKT